MKIIIFYYFQKQTPADCVKYNLINVLSAYAFTARYFNGEYFHFIQEAVTCIISLSQTLKLAQNFEDFETSIKSVEQECINVKYSFALYFFIIKLF